MKSIRYLFLIVILLFTSGCDQLLSFTTDTSSMEHIYAEKAFKEIFDNTRGNLTIENVDWICLSSYHSDEPIPENKELIEGIMLEVCSFYITYTREAIETQLHATVNIVNGKYNNSEADDYDEIFELESEFNLTIEELDELYVDTLDIIREEFDFSEYDALINEVDLLSGTLNQQEIRQIVRKLE